MWCWFCTRHCSSDLKCPLSGAITNALWHFKITYHLRYTYLPDSMNKSECDVKTQTQACHFSFLFYLSSLSSFIVSHVFDGIRTQGFGILSPILCQLSKLVTSGKQNIWSCNRNCVQKRLKVLAVLPPPVFISVETAVICTYWYVFRVLWKSSHRYVFVRRSG